MGNGAHRHQRVPPPPPLPIFFSESERDEASVFNMCGLFRGCV